MPVPILMTHLMWLTLCNLCRLCNPNMGNPVVFRLSEDMTMAQVCGVRHTVVDIVSCYQALNLSTRALLDQWSVCWAILSVHRQNSKVTLESISGVPHRHCLCVFPGKLNEIRSVVCLLCTYHVADAYFLLYM